MLNPAIIALVHDGQTKILDLSSYQELGQDLTGDDAIELARHLPHSQIDTLNMRNVGLTYNGVVAIMNNAKHSNITDLTLSYNNLADESATYIANNLGNLRYLDLEGNNITNNGAIELIQCLARGSLQILGLDNNTDINVNVTQVFRDALKKYPYIINISIPFSDEIIDNYIIRNTEVLDCAKQVINTLKDINNISWEHIGSLDKQYYQAFEIFYKTGKMSLVWESDRDLMQLPNKEYITTKIQQAITNYYPQITHIVSGDHLESDMARNVSLADLDQAGILGEVFKYCNVSDVHY